MREFVASSKELSCAQLAALPEEVKEKEKERIEKDGLGVLKVFAILGTPIFSIAEQSVLTFLCAREMGYTHFDCEEIPAPVVPRNDKTLLAKKPRSGPGYYGERTPEELAAMSRLEEQWRATMLRPATPTRRVVSTTPRNLR